MSDKIKNLSIDLIKTDGGTQMRAELSKDVYLDYRDKWIAGVEFDPCDVFHDGSEYWLADGFHRFYGAREAKRASLPCRIHQGTQRDAILFACGANASHGLRRTNADKRQAVETLLNDTEWVKWSDNKIAEQAAVNQSTVSAIRKELMESISSPAAKSADQPRVGRDGKKRKPPKKPTNLQPRSATGGGTSPAAPPGLPTEGTVNQAEHGAQGTGAQAGITQYADTFDPATMPDTVADLAVLQQPYDEILNALNAITKVWNKIVDDDLHGAYAVEKRQRVLTILKDLRAPIAQARPHKLCKHCSGKGCQRCRGTGWWPRSVVEGLEK